MDFLGDGFFADGFLVVILEDFAFLATDVYFLVEGADLVVERLALDAGVVAATFAFGLVAGVFFNVDDLAGLAAGAVDFLEDGFADALLVGAFYIREGGQASNVSLSRCKHDKVCARTSLAASLRTLGASLTFPDGPGICREVFRSMIRMLIYETTFRKYEGSFLGPVGDGPVELTGSGRAQINVILRFHKLDSQLMIGKR